MRRWVCPECGSTANAPERPRKRDVRRYCLPCSGRTGHWVERSCPVLERQRGRAAARRADKQRKQRDRARAKWLVAGLDVRQLARQCWRALQQTGHCRAGRAVPTLYVKRTTRGSRGYAHAHGSCQLYFGEDADQAKVKELVLHELTHQAVGVSHWHDAVFNGALADAAHALWGYPGGGGEGYSGSHALLDWLHEQQEQQP